MKDFEIAENIKKLRKKKGWTQQKLATLSKLSYNAVIKIEQKRSLEPTIQSIEKLATAFEISIDELIGREKV